MFEQFKRDTVIGKIYEEYSYSAETVSVRCFWKPLRRLFFKKPGVNK